MRTTVDLADHLLVRAKKLAAEQHTTLTAVLEESLRVYLAALPDESGRRTSRTKLPMGDGGKPVEGVDLNDTSALMDIP